MKKRIISMCLIVFVIIIFLSMIPVSVSATSKKSNNFYYLNDYGTMYFVMIKDDFKAGTLESIV